MTDRITAPFTEPQVAALNAFQRSGVMPPLTCEMPHRLRQTLIAEWDGLRCPDQDCDYQQTWAHAFMAEPATVTPAPWPQPPDTPMAAELRRVRQELRDTQRDLAEERQRVAELQGRLQALQIHEAIQRIPGPAAPACGEILHGQTITTTGSIDTWQEAGA